MRYPARRARLEAAALSRRELAVAAKTRCYTDMSSEASVFGCVRRQGSVGLSAVIEWLRSAPKSMTQKLTSQCCRRQLVNKRLSLQFSLSSPGVSQRASTEDEDGARPSSMILGHDRCRDKKDSAIASRLARPCEAENQNEVLRHAKKAAFLILEPETDFRGKDGPAARYKQKRRARKPATFRSI
ncbi:hypothetical protein HPB50_013225 [Hyalomma asiaticum]|uniref:Uncharacterized protein n=1 Tax=Hyalomma asiaticum TaxID=266040 RepID=A0ACB7TJJ8_HYAAI|nr:hypothetical protein HPB50_013225 [Hyalomma asiaticum]